MSFGIGLGAFVEGFERGQRARERMDDRREKRDNKARLAEIDAEAKAAFDEGVAEGTQDPKSYDQFWKDYALPKRRNELLRQGDVSGAKALDEWGQSDAALQGGRLFSRALLAAQTGDHAGALDLAIEAGKVKGYIEHGYELTGHQPIQDTAGNTVGYRITAKDGDGNELEQDVPLDKMGDMIATFVNPDAAWTSQQEQRAAQAKRDQEIADRDEERAYERAETDEDRAYDEGQEERKRLREEKKAASEKPEKEAAQRGEDYDAAVEHLADSDINWSDYAPEERQAKIDAHLAQKRAYVTGDGAKTAPGLGDPTLGGDAGASAAPARPATGNRVAVDQRSGQIVQPEAREATGIVQTPQAQPQGAAAKQDRVQSPNAIQQSLVRTQAKRAIQQGASPDQVARQMRAVGIGDQEIQDLLR